jgi:hypothetical protein
MSLTITKEQECAFKARSPLAKRIAARFYGDGPSAPLWQIVDEETARMPEHRVAIGDAAGTRATLRRVSFHYHKAASRRAGRNVLSVHWKGKCHLVHHILCAVKLETHHQKKQPHCILRGFARQVLIHEGLGERWRGGVVAKIT